MAFQSVPNGVEIVLNGVQNGVPVVNVFNVKDEDEPTPARLQTIADQVKTWFTTYYAPILHESYTLQNIKVTALTAATGPQVTATYTTGVTGLQSGAAAAANAAAVVSWRTSAIGRSFRGRTYFGALAATELSNAQTVAGAAQAAMLNAGVELIEVLGNIGLVLSVLSRYANGVLRVTGLLTEIINVFVDNKVDSQRRRTAN